MKDTGRTLISNTGSVVGGAKVINFGSLDGSILGGMNGLDLYCYCGNDPLM